MGPASKMRSTLPSRGVARELGLNWAPGVGAGHREHDRAIDLRNNFGGDRMVGVSQRDAAGLVNVRFGHVEFGGNLGSFFGGDIKDQTDRAGPELFHEAMTEIVAAGPR